MGFISHQDIFTGRFFLTSSDLFRTWKANCKKSGQTPLTENGPHEAFVTHFIIKPYLNFTAKKILCFGSELAKKYVRNIQSIVTKWYQIIHYTFWSSWGIKHEKRKLSHMDLRWTSKVAKTNWMEKVDYWDLILYGHATPRWDIRSQIHGEISGSSNFSTKDLSKYYWKRSILKKCFRMDLQNDHAGWKLGGVHRRKNQSVAWP